MVPVVVDRNSIDLFSIADRVAQTDATVLITGETGTGKEVLAQYIHKMSDRCSGNFVAINCAAIPENLLESELFGHEKGAFTGAFQKKSGKFEEADHGTLLLDEISEMPLLLQSKLLRVLQEREFSRLGSNEKIKLDVRIISTSNRDLEQAISERIFREDLYYRLNVIPLKVQPLRNRKMDIIPLAIYFCKKYSKSTKILTKDLLNLLKEKEWKGNVRELENFVHRAIVLSQKNIIGISDIPELKQTTREEITSNHKNSSKSIIEFRSPRKTLLEIEKEAIMAALEEFQGNKSKVSEKLGIPPRTLRYKLKKYIAEEGKQCPTRVEDFHNKKLA